MHSRRCIFAFVVALGCAAFAASASGTGTKAIDARSTATSAQIIERIASEANDDRFFDMHGNANADLQRLMVLRFGATKDAMRAIDRISGNASLAPARNALFRVLGFVKDPASIDWLRAQHRSNAQHFYDEYVPRWKERFDGYGSWEWLTGRQRWIAFWMAAFDDEPSPERRIELLGVLDQFDDASVIAFFGKRRVAATEPMEILLVESYLSEHDVPADVERVTRALAALRDVPANHEFLIAVARRLRHEAFVPFLVDIADWTHPNRFPPAYDAQRALQAITLACDLNGTLTWRFWYLVHGMEGRDAWRRRAVDALRTTLASNPAEAAKRFEKLVYCWNDIALLGFMQDEIAPHAEFRNRLAGWVNLTYSDFYRERLRPLALRAGASDLEDWARRRLQERGYLPGWHKQTWAEAVERDNFRL